MAVNNLVDKAKNFAENIPGDMKEKEGELLGGIKDKLGL